MATPFSDLRAQVLIVEDEPEHADAITTRPMLQRAAPGPDRIAA